MALMQGLIKKLGGEDDDYSYHQPPGMAAPAGGGGLKPVGPGQPIGGGDRGYEMPGMGSSGGVEDAGRMLAEATARNNRLKDIGNRRSQIDIFDRAGHTALDQEESSIFGRPRSSYVDSVPNGAPGPAAPSGGGGLSPSVFQSNNTSARGYLDEAIRSFAPTIKGLSGEDARQRAAQDYLNSLIPEVEKRGGKMSDVRNEAFTLDGRVLDAFRDIEGAADPQLLDITDQARGGGMTAGRPSFQGSSIAPLLQGDAAGNIQQLLGKFAQTQDDSLLQRLIAQLNPGA